MTDLETTVRTALARRLQLARVPAVEVWDDEAVAAILRAAGQREPAPSGRAGIRDAGRPETGAELAAATGDLASRAAELETLAGDLLAAFKPRKTGGGYNAYANDSTMAGWRGRLGEQPGGDDAST